MAAQLIEILVWQKRQTTVRTVIQPQGGGPGTPSDIFVGTDTYGWPEEDPPWCPPQRANIVLLSAGLIIVPNVVGQFLGTAQSILLGVGLTNTTSGIYSTTVPIGFVISQSPVGGTITVAGANVALIYSLGPNTAIPCLPPPTGQAGFGGNKWGASGGSATPINASTPLAQALSTGVNPANALNEAPNRSVLADASNTQLPLSTPYCLVPTTPEVG